MPGPRELLLDSVKALERQTAGFHILGEFVRSVAPREQVVHDLLGKVLDLVGADAGAIAMADEANGVFNFVAFRWANQTAGSVAAKEKALGLFRVRLTEGIIGQVFQSREPLILPDVSKNQTFRKDMADAADYHVNNLLAVPIQTESQRLGVLELFNKTPRGTFSSADMELAVSLGRQIALVWETLKLRHPNAASAAPDPVPAPPATDELLDARRAARDAQSQLKETQRLLDTAMRSREHDVRRLQALSDELERVQALADAATPAQQILRLLHSVEPIAFALSPTSLMKNASELCARLVNAQTVHFFLWNEAQQTLSLGHSTAAPGGGQPIPLSFKKGEGVAGRAAEGTDVVRVDAAKDERVSAAIDGLSGGTPKSLMAAPLVVNGRLQGVLEAVNRADGQAFSPAEGVSLSGLAVLTAAALDKAMAHQKWVDLSRSTVACLVDLLTAGGVPRSGGDGPASIERFRRRVAAVATAAGLTADEQIDAEWAALLCRLGRLDGFAGSAPLTGAVSVLRSIQERWDGTGTPDKKAGESIPFPSRVVAVVKKLDELTRGADGRAPLSPAEGIKELESAAGTQFDAACVDALARWVRAGGWEHP
jgi:GAF domain-containing protein